MLLYYCYCSRKLGRGCKPCEDTIFVYQYIVCCNKGMCCFLIICILYRQGRTDCRRYVSSYILFDTSCFRRIPNPFSPFHFRWQGIKSVEQNIESNRRISSHKQWSRSSIVVEIPCKVGGFKDFLFSPRKLGKIPSLTNIFQGVPLKPPTSHGFSLAHLRLGRRLRSLKALRQSLQRLDVERCLEAVILIYFVACFWMAIMLDVSICICFRNVYGWILGLEKVDRRLNDGSYRIEFPFLVHSRFTG